MHPAGWNLGKGQFPAGCNVFNYRFKTGAAGFEPAQLQSGRTNQLKAYSQQQQGSNLHTPVEERTNRPPKFAGLSRLSRLGGVVPHLTWQLPLLSRGAAASLLGLFQIASAGKRSRYSGQFPPDARFYLRIMACLCYRVNLFLLRSSPASELSFTIEWSVT